MRYEVKVQLSTEEDIEKVKRSISSLSKSGKIEIHWIRTQTLKPRGRPQEIAVDIAGYLKGQTKPKSALQIARKIERAQTSLYPVLAKLEAAGKVLKSYDDRWKVNRYIWADNVKVETGTEPGPWD